MTPLRVAAERRIQAPPSAIYAVIRDYRGPHLEVLPSAYRNLTIERGGSGAGTLFTVGVKLGLRTARYRCEVAEPQPGHRLEERDPAAAFVKAYSVLPGPDGAIVRIESTHDNLGLVQRLRDPGRLRKLHEEELRRLAEYIAMSRR